MKDNNCSVKETIIKLVFISNNDNNDLKKAEIDWMEELFSFIKDTHENEYLEVKEAFYKKIIINQITR